MGIEPTWDSYEPHTDFEDQGHHQEPVTSNHKDSLYEWHLNFSKCFVIHGL